MVCLLLCVGVSWCRVRVLLLRCVLCCVIVLCDCVCVLVRRVWCVAATVGKSCDAYAVFVCVR